MEKKTLGELYRELGASSAGLSQTEASKRLIKFGLNALGSKKKLVLVKNILDQFTDFLVILLLIASALSIMLGDVKTAMVMLAIVGLNASIGFTQQFRTERTLEALKNLLPHKSRVLRDGKEREILSAHLVPGDVVILQAGDSVPADGQIIEQYSLVTNESSLTGESSPQTKHELADEKHPNANMVFMGTVVIEGEAKILITCTGTQTQFGQIAQKTKEVDEDLSPLQKKLREVGRKVANIAGSIMVIIIIYLLIKNVGIEHKTVEADLLRNIFLFGLALAASLVPEGLPATVSVALSLGANRLIKKKAVVKKLSSVETLGSTNVICTDKTGTLTVGKMSVVCFSIPAESREPVKYENFDLNNHQFLLSNLSLCQNVSRTEKGLFGDPDEVALCDAVIKKQIDLDKIIDKHKKIHEFSFNPVRKMMSVLIHDGEKYHLLAKGNPAIILGKCKMPDHQQKELLERVDEMANEGLRVFAFAHRIFENKPEKFVAGEMEEEFIFDGFCGIEDDIHPEVPEAILYCHRAGIKIVMVTGDYKVTAASTARKINLAGEGKNFRMVSGEELKKMNDLELRENLQHPIVFYQTDPSEKLRIVDTLQKMGQVVAVTGDGVNDALALKKADIGVAMGKVGTDVAKEAADMVLLDDNFATIVNAVKEGRIIWDNLKKFLFYIFSSNAGEFMTVFFGLLFGLPAPILAIQILSVDLGTDVLPSLALVADPAQQDILDRPVVKKEELLSASIIYRLFYVGLIMGGGGALNYWLINRSGAEGTELYFRATGAAFATLVVCQVVNVFQVRGGFSSLKEALFGNKYLIWSVLAEVLILLGVIYWSPLQSLLSTKALSFREWLPIFGVGLFFLITEEIRKMFKVENKVLIKKADINLEGEA